MRQLAFIFNQHSSVTLTDNLLVYFSDPAERCKRRRRSRDGESQVSGVQSSDDRGGGRVSHTLSPGQTLHNTSQLRVSAEQILIPS